MVDLIKQEQALDGPIEEGDIGLVIKSNGDVRIFTTGSMSVEADMDEAKNQRMQKLLGLLFAANNETIQIMLSELINNPDVVNPEINVKLSS